VEKPDETNSVTTTRRKHKMRKKIVSILAAALLALSMAAPAMATYFNDNDLIQIVYNTAGGNEVATDLGAISGSTFTSNGSLSFLGGGTITGTGVNAAVTGGTTFSGVKLSSINVTYLAYDLSNSNNPIYFSSNSSTPPVYQNGGQWGNANSLLQSLYFNGTGTQQQVVVSTSNNNSFAYNFGSTPGDIGGLLTTASSESTLTGLASGGTITQKLYYFADTANGSTAQDLALNLITNSAGTFTAADASTPIPPSFLLMGSGLLGMVGIRRKFTA
jgi:hypothetical protein